MGGRLRKALRHCLRGLRDAKANPEDERGVLSRCHRARRSGLVSELEERFPFLGAASTGMAIVDSRFINSGSNMIVSGKASFGFWMRFNSCCAAISPMRRSGWRIVVRLGV